jgi:AcrR family transcriptional regulator
LFDMRPLYCDRDSLRGMKPETRSASPNTRPATVRSHDQRAAQSREALQAALTSLLHEKPFATITVQELVRRARVGRTTFYAHFQDPNDLLLTSFTRMLEWMSEHVNAEPRTTGRLLPVREFFEHVASAKQFLAMLQDSDRLTTLWRLATLHFAKSIEHRVGGPLAARFAAGAMIEVLQWWLDQRDPPPAAQIDRNFHALLSTRSGHPWPGRRC